MKNCLLIFTLSFATNLGVCQLVYKPEVYRNKVLQFYKKINSAKLKDYYDIFGTHAEDEEWLFFMKCDRGKATSNCVTKFKERYSRWSSFESLVFLELKKIRVDLTQNEDESLEEVISNARINECFWSNSIDLILTFKNKKRIIFSINNVPSEVPFIYDIYMQDGCSVFNKVKESVGVTFNKNYYERLAILKKPNDSVGISEGKGTKFKIKGKLLSQELFFVYPNSESWWKILKIDCQSGFIPKSEVKLIGEFGNLEVKSFKERVTRIYEYPLKCDGQH